MGHSGHMGHYNTTTRNGGKWSHSGHLLSVLQTADGTGDMEQ